MLEYIYVPVCKKARQAASHSFHRRLGIDTLVAASRLEKVAVVRNQIKIASRHAGLVFNYLAHEGGQQLVLVFLLAPDLGNALDGIQTVLSHGTEVYLLPAFRGEGRPTGEVVRSGNESSFCGNKKHGHDSAGIVK